MSMRAALIGSGAMLCAVTLTLAAQTPVERARQYLARDSADDATRVLESAIAASPDNASYHLWLAAAYAEDGARANFFRQIGYTLRVRRELERAVALDPTSVDAHSEMSRFYMTASPLFGGSLQRAEAEARAIAVASPSRSHGLLGWVAHHRGDLRTAEREMRAAVAAGPDSAWGYTALAHLMSDEDRNDEAFALWQRSVALDTTYKASLFEMGQIGATTGTHLADAALALQRYVAAPPRKSDTQGIGAAHHQLGVVYEKAGRVADARREFEAALKLRPGSATYKAALARVK
ncbi:MAG: tetratricopeptide repeat protein [Gemmatimonadota bacterium]|nr:tetratricopeptide repeat protein [Gemmatimonadota bacterium]